MEVVWNYVSSFTPLRGNTEIQPNLGKKVILRLPGVSYVPNWAIASYIKSQYFP